MIKHNTKEYWIIIIHNDRNVYIIKIFNQHQQNTFKKSYNFMFNL